ncbi:MAG: SusC/RagA family TonB-linked outer membrane protein [Bacteroidales bacterium]|nr:SusC/RagA family TonB-linked outer membrane protein [Bacteroidales bacterium]
MKKPQNLRKNLKQCSPLMKMQLVVVIFMFFGFQTFGNQALTANLNASANEGDAVEMSDEAAPEQQQVTVTGSVTDNQGNPLPGVNIVVEGTTTGTTTDMDGNYSIEVPADATLVFSFVGYQEQSIDVGGREEINITMQQGAVKMKEVVAIGYGQVQREEVTSSVSSVSADEMNIDPAASTDLTRVLQGKVAGLTITRTGGGNPNQDFEIRLRGTSSVSAGQEPLIVVDGVPGGSLDALNPEDINSIDVLKGASAAAMYGTRGTNGVILVETKTGQEGEQQDFHITYSSKMFTETVLRETEVLSAEGFRQLKQDLQSEHPDQAAAMIDQGYSTDWFDEVQRDFPVNYNQTLAIRGGGETTTYRLSGSHMKHDGMFINTGREEYKVNLNLTQRALNDMLMFKAQLGTYEIQAKPTDSYAYRQAMGYNPTAPLYFEGDPEQGLYQNWGGWEYENPVGVLSQRTDKDRSSRYYTRFTGQFMPNDAWTFKTQIGYDIERGMDGYYQPIDSYNQQQAGTYGNAQRSADRDVTRTLESTIDWDKDIGNHSINVIGGYSYQKFVGDGFWANNTNFISDEFQYNNLGAGTYLEEGKADMDSWKWDSKLVGFFARGIYDWNDKYYLSASVRREGSSKFGEENKWGTFPAVSVGWTVTNESFAEGLEWLDFLKLRAGYGKTGNQDIGNYIPLVRLAPGGYFYYNGEYRQTYGPVSNPNPNLKWETKHEYDIGIDWEVLDGRLGGNIDLYTRRTEDLLHDYDVPVPPNLYGTTFANVGTMENQGIEFTFNTVPVQQENLQWNLNFSFNYRTQELVSLSNERYKLDWHNAGWLSAPGVQTWTHRYGEGMDMGNFHGWVFEGIGEDGQWQFKDLDEDGDVDEDDKKVIGNGIPDYYVNLNTTLNYKNWQFSVMARGQFGHEILNAKELYYENRKLLPKNILADYNDKLWEEPKYSDYYLENGDWVKIDNISLGYNVPFENNELVKSLRVYGSVRNAFVITQSEVNDPEVSIGGLTPGISGRYDYPSVRTWTLGIEAKF